MDPKPERPLEYADARLRPRPPSPVAFATGVLCLAVGILVFVIGVMAFGTSLKRGEVDPREWMFILVGAFICWVGMKLKGGRPAE